MMETIIIAIIGAIITTIAVKLERRRQRMIAEYQYEVVAKHVCYHSVRDTIYALKEHYKIEDDADDMLETVKVYVRKKVGETGNALL